MTRDHSFPSLLITLGDVAGIGPEIVAKAWPQLTLMCQATVVGDPAFLPPGIPCVNATQANLKNVTPGRVSRDAGQAAYDWLIHAIDECLAGRADAIVTCPLHKEGLHAADVTFPGHTEILAARTNSPSHSMLLYDDELPLAISHVTLHTSVRKALDDISIESVLGKIRLLNDMIPKLANQPARIGVMAMNPHASDGGLFGDEEATIIRPAIELAKKDGMDVLGPVPTDAAFLPANRTKVNGYVAMLHDHGHIPMKLLGGRRAINVTAGLPIIRTSVAHGTAYDIAGKGIADEQSLIQAVRIASRLHLSRRTAKPVGRQQPA